MMIRRDRMVDTVLNLIRLDSHSRDERLVADYVVGALQKLDCDVAVDDAGREVGGNAGNVIARVKPSRSDAPPLLLSAHMDVVPPGKGVNPVVEAERIRSDGTTILGGDDKTGLAVILETLAALAEHDVPHGPIEVVFSICEEVGLLGAKHVDCDALSSKEAIVLDSGSSSRLVTRAPSSDGFEFVVHGLEAHAGMCPERGISAVRVAAQAIASMPLGRIDAETTSNAVILECPAATNVVPNRCVVRGEARSLNDARLDAIMREIRRCFQDAAAGASATLDGTVQRAWIEERSQRTYHSMHVPDEAPIAQLVLGAAKAIGSEIETVSIGGGSDANVYNRRGIQSVNLGTGMRDIHTVNEWIDLADFYRCADIVLECVRRRAAA